MKEYTVYTRFRKPYKVNGDSIIINNKFLIIYYNGFIQCMFKVKDIIKIL